MTQDIIYHWQTVFPEFDRSVYERARFGGKQEFGVAPALIVVDVVESFTGSSRRDVLSSIDEYRTSCGEQAWDRLDNIATVIETCRRSGVPVVYTKGSVRDKSFCGDSVKGTEPSEIAKIYGSPIASGVAPTATEYVLEKTKASAFFGTPLAAYLHKLKVDSLLICGTSTSGCVRATVVDAFSNNYSVFVVEEGVFDRSGFSNAVNLFEMNAKYASVVTLAQTLSYLLERSGFAAGSG